MPIDDKPPPMIVDQLAAGERRMRAHDRGAGEQRHSDRELLTARDSALVTSLFPPSRRWVFCPF